MTNHKRHKESEQQYFLVNHIPRIGLQAMRTEIMEGLKEFPRRIPSKYFYDKEGSALFQEITSLPEYYLSRTEKEILPSLWDKLTIDLPNLQIIELGSGDCSKIELLLNGIPESTVQTITYYPVDISSHAIKEAANKLMLQFPGLRIRGVVADFFHQMHLLPRENKRLFCFFGSTIGNLNNNEINAFMEELGSVMVNGDHLLLGLDMIKDLDVLEKAYNDKRGVTARFNKNILKVANELLEADFEPHFFDHRAFYNKEHHRVEMHLVARENMIVTCGLNNSTIELKAGENIHTENSHKFDRNHIQNMGKTSGLTIRQVFTDPQQWFSLVLYSK